MKLNKQSFTHIVSLYVLINIVLNILLIPTFYSQSNDNLSEEATIAINELPIESPMENEQTENSLDEVKPSEENGQTQSPEGSESSIDKASTTTIEENSVNEEKVQDTTKQEEESENDEPVFDVELSIFTEDLSLDGSIKTAYYTGEAINGLAQMITSGNDVSIENAKAIITIPKKYLANTTTFAKVESASEWKVTQDNENWYATYIFSSLKGGQIIAIPFYIIAIQFKTPNGVETPIQFSLYDATGRVNYLKILAPSLHTLLTLILRRK